MTIDPATSSVEGTEPAERFITAWKRLEQELQSRWRQEGRPSTPSSDELLRWSESSGDVPRATSKFLHACRRARNAYAHIVFDGYDGPVTVPPTEVVQRLERVVSRLTSPAKAGSSAFAAITCRSSTTVQEALFTMRQHDFSQLPYWLPETGWALVTREQISTWVEASAEREGAALVDLAEPVRTLAEHEHVGPVVPQVLSPAAAIEDALELLERASHLDDRLPGGYPVVLVTRPCPDAAVRILTADDLPRIYTLLGR